MFHSTFPQAHERVTVRHADAGDTTALRRLAALDSSDAPSGPVLLAESEAAILAAMPLDGGRAIADPFERTAELLDLLELRRAQLARERAGNGSRLAARVRGLMRLRVTESRA